MFWRQVLQNKLTLLCKCLLMCLKLLFVFVATIACYLYLTCFFVLLTIAICSMLCYYVWFFFPLSVLNIIYVHDLESVLFDSKNFYNVLLLTCSMILLICLYMWIYGTQIKYHIISY
jgi:hypothetical protein